MSFFSSIVVAVCLIMANASALSSRSLSGEATFYGGNVAGGACSFSTYTIPTGIYGTALSDSNWDNSANCGVCVSVAGPDGNSITAMIVDECPGCGRNHLDLFPDAFAELADPSEGIIEISWDYIDCPITTPLQVHNKEGVSAYWFSMQVVNANKAVSSLEVSTDGGSTWQSTTRQTYNFFQNVSGFGTTSVDVKITSDDGDVVMIEDVEVSSGVAKTAGSNFGTSDGPASAATSTNTPITKAAAETIPSSPLTSSSVIVAEEGSSTIQSFGSEETTTQESGSGSGTVAQSASSSLLVTPNTTTRLMSSIVNSPSETLSAISSTQSTTTFPGGCAVALTSTITVYPAEVTETVTALGQATPIAAQFWENVASSTQTSTTTLLYSNKTVASTALANPSRQTSTSAIFTGGALSSRLCVSRLSMVVVLGVANLIL